MQELLGRLTALDPDASAALRVIACFDELIVGHVNTRGLLGAAAALAGCTAGFRQSRPARLVRITPRGMPATDHWDPPDLPDRDFSVWLERVGPSQANDAIITERLEFAVRIRHSAGRRDLDSRRDLAVTLDPAAELDDRRACAARIGLTPGRTYRVLAAPLFATWHEHPKATEDVVTTSFGPIHALVVPQGAPPPDARPCGVGTTAVVDDLHRSFRSALVALRLCDSAAPVVRADDYGALIGLLADSPDSANSPDVDLLDGVMAHAWGMVTLDALLRAGSVRQAARSCGVHHSTMTARVGTIADVIGFDPLDGLGRTRLGLAFLMWRLRHSTVLELPVHAARRAAGGG